MVVVAPAATKAIARVVLVEARLRSDIAKRSVAIVAHHEIRRTVLGRVIRSRVFVLIRALVIDVEAEINVEPAVAVIVGGRRAREGSLRRNRELKRIRLEAELAAAMIQEQLRTVRP